MRRCPEPEQVAGRGQAAVPVRRADRWRVVERLAGRVDDDIGDPARAQLLAHDVGQVGEDRDHAGRPAGEDALDPAAARRPPALHLREHDREVVLPGHALDAADDLEGPLALELVEDDLDQRGAAGRALRSLVPDIADRGLHPAARLGRHVRAAVDDLRDGRDRDPGLLGDLGDGRGSSWAAGLGPDGGSGHGRECTESFDARVAESARSDRGSARERCHRETGQIDLDAPPEPHYGSGAKPIAPVVETFGRGGVAHADRPGDQGRGRAKTLTAPCRTVSSIRV